jgi:hypothetical protein
MNAYRILVGKPDGKRPLGRPRLGGFTILVWILERGCDGTDWIDLAEDRDKWRALMNTMMNLQVP